MALRLLFSYSDVLAANPGARLALVGDGPARAQLEAHFAVRPAASAAGSLLPLL